MTSPNYEDKDRVSGMELKTLRSIASQTLFDKDFLTHEESARNSWVRVARVAVRLWEGRDKAREIAALQDKAIHKSAGWVWVLERLWMAVLQAKNTGFMPKFSGVDKALDNIEVEKAKRDGSNKQGEEK